jgi:hypothetical protein
VVINSLIVERPHELVASPPLDANYRDSNGLITMCCHCRRVCQVTARSAWDWVPAFVQSPPANVSHGICTPCLNLYYPDERKSRRR